MKNGDRMLQLRRMLPLRTTRMGLEVILVLILATSTHSLPAQNTQKSTTISDFLSNSSSGNEEKRNPSPGTTKETLDLSGDLLPDRLPSGDPAHYALPIFLEEPADDFVVKSRPASLQCKVAHALSVHFQCNDEVIPNSETTNHVDPETGIRYTEAKVKITRNLVDEFFGEYHCACVAVSGQGALKSRLAYVTIAFLKKEFEVPPYSDQSQEGKQVELRCHPPKGKPEPKISWQKNGQMITDFDTNFIVTTEGHLIVVHTKLEDSANYTCVAENIANTRYSTPAELTIYVAGGWSAWSSWSACSATCGKGERKRGRVCNNPVTLVGERPCPGPAVMKKTCPMIPCPGVNGDWSSWSSWSSCSAKCQKRRSRSCSSPPPSNGGFNCFESSRTEDYAQCSGGQCRAWLEPRVGEEPTESTPVMEGHLTLYIGVGVAIAVFLLGALIVASFILRKRNHPGGSGYTLSTSAYEIDPRKKALGYSPDIISAGHTDVTSVCYEYSYPDSNSNHSKIKYGISDRPASEHHYEQPMVILPSRSPVDSIGKPPMSETSSSSLGDGNISPRSGGSFERAPTTQLSRQSSLPDTRFTKWSTLTYTGARIMLQESNVTVTVPEGSVEPGQVQDVFVSVKHDINSAPTLQPGQTLVSPIVVVGPTQASQKFKKPVILSFPHCASLRHGSWTVSLYQSDSGDESTSWRKVVTLGQETINTPIYTQLDLNVCHIITDTLGAFTLVGESAPSGNSYKLLRVAAFAQEYPQGSDLTVRLYCVQDTDEAMKFVSETEKKFGGRLLDKPVSVLFQDGGSNLRLCLERLSEGWSTQQGAETQEVPFSHVWHHNNPSLHCSFTLRHGDPLQRKLGLQVNISQDGNTNRCMLKVNTNISAGSGQSDSSLRSDKARMSPKQELPVFRLPAQTKETLSRMLDFPVSGGNDWRMLAERLNVHRYITFFATRPSPTEAVLNLWEARNRDSGATVGLVNILRGMGRFDAAHLLEHDLQIY